MTDILITGADWLGGGRGDLLVRNGVLADPATAGSDIERFDADGLIALPGLVDLHTHLRQPGREDTETVASGTAAAARAAIRRSWPWRTPHPSPTRRRPPNTWLNSADGTGWFRWCRSA